jgi:hypothetical protein
VEAFDGFHHYAPNHDGERADRIFVLDKGRIAETGSQ